jgi:phage gp36-like protein
MERPMGTATGDRLTRRHVMKTIRKLIMRSDDPGLDAFHLHYALQDAQRDRDKKDGKKPIDPEAFAKMLGL